MSTVTDPTALGRLAARGLARLDASRLSIVTDGDGAAVTAHTPRGPVPGRWDVGQLVAARAVLRRP